MTEPVYRVNEIFYSLQGEGFYTGTPAVFLRFSGCNRLCPFCDTDHHAFREMTAAEIAAEVSSFPSRHLVATGGEPLLQLDSYLLRALKARGFYVQVETNGSRPVPPEVDWVTCSPKEGPWDIGRIDELKVVYQNSPDHLLRLAELLPATHHFAQPLSGGNVPETIRFCLDHPRWRLSLQTHKLIDIR
ncbi:MAG: 7-carboxy-7-deazaguanine synthase QueE [Muribaculaceae bacterium]|nr:7-carboxy-7-deazaguanine synthase QueE [Muribaculaceae bacterium]